MARVTRCLRCRPRYWPRRYPPCRLDLRHLRHQSPRHQRRLHRHRPCRQRRLHGVEQLALAALASNPFADASDAFFLDFEAAINRALSGRVKLVRPFGQMSKRQVMQLGGDLPLDLTFSCFSPAHGLHCGRCNKCAERRRAFADAGLPDPTRYAAVREIA